MRVTITGAAGKLGKATWQALLDAGHEVTGTDMHRDPTLPGPVHVANLLDREACYHVFDNTDALVHLGNHPNADILNPQRLYAENCTMNAHIMQAALQSGVKQIVFSSSIQVYGGSSNSESPRTSPDWLPMDSDLPIRPENTYAASKVAGETLLEMFVRGGLPSGTALRFPQLTGSHILHKYRANRQRWGWPGEGFSFLDLQDAGALILAVLERNPPGYRARFIAHPAPINQTPVQELLNTHYAEVPLKLPREQITSLVDQETIFRETEWRPLRGFPPA